MRTRQTQHVSLGLLLCLAIAGCDQGEPKRERTGDVAVEQETSTPQVAGTTQTTEPKSIIRPTVLDIKPLPPPATETDLTISFGDRSTALDDEARALLDDLLDAPALKAGGKITLRGHSDTRGFDGDNLVASRLRAETVRDYLESKGIARDRMTVIALGETRPIAPNAQLDGSDDPEGRAKNRRVDIHVALPDAPPDASAE